MKSDRLPETFVRLMERQQISLIRTWATYNEWDKHIEEQLKKYGGSVYEAQTAPRGGNT